MKHSSHPRADALVALPVNTPLGRFVAVYSPRGLAQLKFPGAAPARQVASAARAPAQARRWHRLTTAALRRVLGGAAAGRLPPLDWAGATPFQRRVWEALRQLPPGQTRSYGEIARVLGRPQAARAVGGACGANPVPVLVPCHRVLASGGRLGGFSGGLKWKRLLLAREGQRVQ
jgi:O-6-methylguanine DNA methyltransferase